MADHARDKLLARSEVLVRHADHLLGDGDDWLTPEYVADHLAVSRVQVYRWIKAGYFGETLKLGRRAVRISRTAYQQFVALRKTA